MCGLSWGNKSILTKSPAIGMEKSLQSNIVLDQASVKDFCEFLYEQLSNLICQADGSSMEMM